MATNELLPHFVVMDPQAQQASVHHIMMLRQQHLELLRASTIQGYQCTLLSNITLLGA
jgi:hypothetical protein